MDGNLEYCGDDSNFDLSQLEFIPYNDTHMFMNGTLTFKNLIKAPWPARGTLERSQNGKWQQSMLSRKIQDFCSVVHNPVEPWYSLTKNFMEVKCPIQAGTQLIFQNQQLNDFNLAMPRNMVGKWRLTLQSEIKGDTKKVIHECHRVFFEFVET
ncbi:unnamed protein product [Diamesa serratosioi]